MTASLIARCRSLMAGFVFSAGHAWAATTGFVDGLTLATQGSGSLRGVVQFAQSHVIFPRGNESRSLPTLVANRTALVIFIPAATEGPIGSLTLTASRGATKLGSLNLDPPTRFPRSDQPANQPNRVEYATNAWSVRLPWDWVAPGLTLKIVSNDGKQHAVSDLDFSAPSELVLQHIRIGMLTEPPNATHMELTPARAASDYFQKLPIAKLVLAQYEPVQFNRITLPNGTVYTSASRDSGDVYHGDLRTQIAKALVSVGINLANFGISSSAGSSQAQPWHYPQVVIHHADGTYANGLISHGRSGGNGMATLLRTSLNEFSHELGHNFKLDHFPRGYAGSVHNRLTGWGYDADRHRMIGNLNWRASSDIYNDGHTRRQIDTFAGYAYNTDAMASGDVAGEVSMYTQHTGYVAHRIQTEILKHGVIDQSSSTGYKKWHDASNSMRELREAGRLKPEAFGVPVATLVGYYDPQRKLPSVVYPALIGGYGMTYSTASLNHGDAADCRLVVRTKDSSPFVAKLADTRLKANEMNKFHVNVPLAKQPSWATVECRKSGTWVTLASQSITTPANFQPKVTKVGGTAGFPSDK